MRHALTGDKGRRTAAATTEYGLAVVLLAGWPSGCTSIKPVTMSPEAAFPACEAEALHEARRIDPTVQGVQLEPLSSAQVERRSPPPGREGVQLVIQGHGSEVVAAPATRYTCLVGTAGDVLFVSLSSLRVRERSWRSASPGRPSSTPACATSRPAPTAPWPTPRPPLCAAEARRRAGRKRSEVDEPAAESIGAWRVCATPSARAARRGQQRPRAGVPGRADPARIAELRG